MLKTLFACFFVSPVKHGGLIGNMTPSQSSSFRRHIFGFRLITLEGMNQFHLNFKEGLSIIKYRSSLKNGVICKILTELWPFFDSDNG